MNRKTNGQGRPNSLCESEPDYRYGAGFFDGQYHAVSSTQQQIDPLTWMVYRGRRCQSGLSRTTLPSETKRAGKDHRRFDVDGLSFFVDGLQRRCGNSYRSRYAEGHLRRRGYGNGREWDVAISSQRKCPHHD
jgi:hypothetical protein